MSHSCFAASAFAAATCVFSTLHRLEFPANERVHIQVSLKVETPAFVFNALGVLRQQRTRVANRIPQLFKELAKVYGMKQVWST